MTCDDITQFSVNAADRDDHHPLEALQLMLAMPPHCVMMCSWVFDCSVCCLLFPRGWVAAAFAVEA